MRLLVIGGSDAGISAGLRARELDPSVEVTVLVADGFPNWDAVQMAAQARVRQVRGGQPKQAASHEVGA